MPVAPQTCVCAALGWVSDANRCAQVPLMMMCCLGFVLLSWGPNVIIQTLIAADPRRCAPHLFQA